MHDMCAAIAMVAFISNARLSLSDQPGMFTGFALMWRNETKILNAA